MRGSWKPFWPSHRQKVTVSLLCGQVPAPLRAESRCLVLRIVPSLIMSVISGTHFPIAQLLSLVLKEVMLSEGGFKRNRVGTGPSLPQWRIVSWSQPCQCQITPNETGILSLYSSPRRASIMLPFVLELTNLNLLLCFAVKELSILGSVT